MTYKRRRIIAIGFDQDKPEKQPHFSSPEQLEEWKREQRSKPPAEKLESKHDGEPFIVQAREPQKNFVQRERDKLRRKYGEDPQNPVRCTVFNPQTGEIEEQGP